MNIITWKNVKFKKKNRTAFTDAVPHVTKEKFMERKGIAINGRVSPLYHSGSPTSLPDASNLYPSGVTVSESIAPSASR